MIRSATIRAVLACFILAALVYGWGGKVSAAERGPEVSGPKDAQMQAPATKSGSFSAQQAAFLESLVGTYPDRRILNDPRLKPLLLATIGPKRFQQLTHGWGKRVDDVVVSPIEKIQDSIVITACKPHDCLAFNATLYVSLIDGEVQACWRAEAGEPAFDQWLTTKGVEPLPDGDCTAARRNLQTVER